MEYPHIGKSKFWNDLMHKVYGPRSGGAKLLYDAEAASLGVGKTSAATALARHLADAFGYELEKDDFTLSAGEYVDRYREHPGREQPSVLVLDEAVGAGAGDARRSMSNSNLDLASAWQTMRVKRVVTICTLAHWGDLDSRLQRLADYRCQCRLQPIGRYRPYKITVGFDSAEPRTKKLDGAIHFPDMDGDPYYEYISERKDELLAAQTWDADELAGNADAEADADAEGDEEPGVRDIAQEIIDDDRVEEYVSTHPSNHTRYIDKDMIELDFELVERDARKVQKLLRRERDANATAD